MNEIIDNEKLEKAALDGKRERENFDVQEMEMRKAAEIASFDQIILSQYTKANECKQERANQKDNNATLQQSDHHTICI